MKTTRDLSLTRRIGIGAALVLTALAGCDRKIEAPVKENFRNDEVRVSVNGFAKPVYLYDVDKDGKVDAIEEAESQIVSYVADGYQKKTNLAVYDKLTKVMSPEMRDAASRLMNADNDLAYEIARQRYETVRKE